MDKAPCKVCGRPGRFNDGFGYGQLLCDECHYTNGQPEHLRESRGSLVVIAVLIFCVGLVVFTGVIWAVLGRW